MKRAHGLAFIALSAQVGCIHVDLPSNAPGRVDVARPPVRPGWRGTEAPADPGERGLALLFVGGTGGGASTRSAAWFADETLKVEAVPFELEASHRQFVFPDQPWRARLEQSVARVASSSTRFGPTSVEAAYEHASGALGASLGVGASWDWLRRDGGPQATACLHLRPVLAGCFRSAFYAHDGLQLGGRFILTLTIADWLGSR